MPPALAALHQLQDRAQRLAKARETMAVAANKLLSGPEEHVAQLKVLLGLCGDADPQVNMSPRPHRADALGALGHVPWKRRL